MQDCEGKVGAPDNEDQCGAVLWDYNRQAEVKKLEERERKMRSTRCLPTVT